MEQVVDEEDKGWELLSDEYNEEFRCLSSSEYPGTKGQRHCLCRTLNALHRRLCLS